MYHGAFLKFHYDWNELMKVVDKVRDFPNTNDQPKETPIGWSCVDDFRMDKYGIFFNIYTFTEIGFKSTYSYNIYIPNKLDASNCESYIECIYKAMVDVAKWCKEHAS